MWISTEAWDGSSGVIVQQVLKYLIYGTVTLSAII